MAARLIPGFPKSVDLSRLEFTDARGRRRRRAAIAFATGAALFAATAVAMISGSASAQGPGLLEVLFSSFNRPAHSYASSPAFPREEFGDGRHAKPKRHASNGGATFTVGAGRPVCVRLCDGFFFPASSPAGMTDAASEEASCASVCPDAPTALFYQPGGSDAIEDAISASGERYSALPVALRYRSTQDNTCACHRFLAGAFDPLRDATLRRGDAVMTPNGFLVFRGAERATHTRQDFTALASAGLPRDRRAALQALEQVSAAPQRGAPRSWVAKATPAPPPIKASANLNIIHFAQPGRSATN